MALESVDLIPKNRRGDFLAELLAAYVDQQGLGAMPKGDLDALIVHLFVKYGKDMEFDSFKLSQLFRIRETRLKSLYVTASVKFDQLTDADAWVALAKNLEKDRFEFESLERGQIRFKLENPALYRYLQKWLRMNGGAATYSAASELVTISLGLFFETLEDVYNKCDTELYDRSREIRTHVDNVINQVLQSIGKERLNALKEAGVSDKLGSILDKASKLLSIGTKIAAFV